MNELLIWSAHMSYLIHLTYQSINVVCMNNSTYIRIYVHYTLRVRRDYVSYPPQQTLLKLIINNKIVYKSYHSNQTQSKQKINYQRCHFLLVMEGKSE